MIQGQHPSREPSAEKELILAEIGQFEEKFWRNEEIGEKRLNYFITLQTAAVAGLVALHTTSTNFEPGVLEAATNGVLGMLLLFGVVTYFRMLQRNKVTDEYKATTDYLRRRYGKLFGIADYEVPQGVERRWHEGFRGGLTDTTAAATSALLTALLHSLGGEVEALQGPRLWISSVGMGALCLGLMVWGARRARTGATRRSQVFRANIGAVLCDGRARVLAFERFDVPGAWQLPQGGLEAGEDPEDAVRREVKEEAGISESALVALGQLPELLAYELPAKLRSRKTGRGQVQSWFYLKTTSEPALPPKGEFRAWRWMELSELAQTTVVFRRPGYAKLAEYLEREIRPKLGGRTAESSVE